MPNNALLMFNMGFEHADLLATAPMYSGELATPANTKDMPVYDSIRGDGPYNFDAIEAKLKTANHRDCLTQIAQVNAAHVEPVDFPPFPTEPTRKRSTKGFIPHWMFRTPPKKALKDLLTQNGEKALVNGGGRNKRIRTYVMFHDEVTDQLDFVFLGREQDTKLSSDGEREFGRCDKPLVLEELFREP